ncbi:GFA family protein [Hahella ganghwensis]|uniref:GFA family protein n=1 Tax=Hahella ganghwensis TaxID=286420 RepID=UPI00037CB9E8|nr:GFA family protein [Hahella ganghwensis]
MQLEGSCHCQKVRFTLQSKHPYPFNLCYCSICRKTGGGGGYAINLSGDYETLEVQGKEHMSVYQVKLNDREQSPARRHFCQHCGSALWVWDSRWPELVHPFASAIDSDLPIPPEKTHLMVKYKANWVEPALGSSDRQFDKYPDESIADWHQRLNLEE